MAEIVNLKRFRKRVGREEQAKVAEANRARFGRSKAERDAQSARVERANALLDQHRLGDGGAA